jgi:hypothetical protein
LEQKQAGKQARNKNLQIFKIAESGPGLKESEQAGAWIEIRPGDSLLQYKRASFSLSIVVRIFRSSGNAEPHGQLTTAFVADV